jgi:hypothetical protein
MRRLNSRISSNLKSGVFLFHLTISFIFIFVFGCVFFGFWFVGWGLEITGALNLFGLLVIVDLLCGPFCTLIVFDSGKGRRELAFDFFVIGVVQILALGYGVYSIAQARPLAMVFEVDRFHLVTGADIDPREIDILPEWAQPFSLSEVKVLGIRSPISDAERSALLDAALQGIEPGQKPSWWRDYGESRLSVKESAKKFDALLMSNALKRDFIELKAADALKDFRDGESRSVSELLWLPILSRKTVNWIALIDPNTSRIRGVFPL